MIRRPHGIVYALLAGSLALNLVAAGYFGYGSWRSTRGPRTIESTIDFIAKRYPKDVGDKVRDRLESKRIELGRALDEMKDARRATRRAMGEDPLDRARVEAAFANSRAKSEAFQKVIHAAILEALPELPKDKRGDIDPNESD